MRLIIALCPAIWLAGFAGLHAAELKLTSPSDFQVVQRTQPGLGQLRIEGEVLPSAPDLVFEASWALEPRDVWTSFAPERNGERFSGAIDVPAGGWFRLSVRARRGADVWAQSTIEHVGVGEVFVVAGQSNSANHGEERQSPRTGRVASFDGKAWRLANDPQAGASGQGGSFLPPLGDGLVEKFGVPVGFVPCGIGATSVREWLPRGTRFPHPPTLTGNVEQLPSGEWASLGGPFEMLTGRMKQLGFHGFRAVLWHQGESDANQQDATRTLPGPLYRQQLEQLIRATGRAIGWEPPWFVAQASYHVPGDEASPEIREAQASLWKEGIALQGPDTDALKGSLRENGGRGVHFSGPGLREHAARWLAAVTPWLEAQLSHPKGAKAPEPTGETRSLTKDDVLSVRDGQFYLEGKRFAEISFNKFDLFWQLYDELAAGRKLDAENAMVQAQDRALRNLHELGFRSIRVFALPWGPEGPAAYVDPAKRKNLYAALDRMLALCDAHQIRIVWSLGAGAFTDAQLDPAKGWIQGEEHLRDLVANPESRNRKLLYRYLDETVERYRAHKAVLMWEISNEVTLQADIGNQDRVYNGERMPSLKDVAVFFDDVARRIKAADPLRLVSSGGSNMRESQWRLYQGQGWKRDTFEDQFKCFELLYARSGVDVIDIHSYPNGQPGYLISDAQGHDLWLDDKGYMTMAQRLRKPLMIGELGLQAAARSDQKIWTATPDYFESYDDTADAKRWMQKTLNSVVEARVPLSYWWCYQSDRPVDRSNRQHFDIDLERHPDLVKCVVDANQRLQAALGVER